MIGSSRDERIQKRAEELYDLIGRAFDISDFVVITFEVDRELAIEADAERQARIWEQQEGIA